MPLYSTKGAKSAISTIYKGCRTDLRLEISHKFLSPAAETCHLFVCSV
jgi:hypothetical protein